MSTGAERNTRFAQRRSSSADHGTCRQLFVSFWHVGLENIPEGKFVHRRVALGEAKELIDAARRASTLVCVSQDDLLAPYHERERRNHEELCRVLSDQHGVALGFDDFLSKDEIDGEEIYVMRPLALAEINGGRLLLVNCHYALAGERNGRALEFEIAADSVTFHLFEALGDSERLTTAPGINPSPHPGKTGD